MKELRANTSEGKRVLEMYTRCIYDELRQIYSTWSNDKEYYFNECREQYANTEDSWGWGIAKCGSWSFIAGWRGYKDGKPILRLETSRNSYLVWFEH